jgi:metallophosphoesterase (TIGR00282 family)
LTSFQYWHVVMIRILFAGDIISRVGRMALRSVLPDFKKSHNVSLCIANVENAAGLFGITQKVIDEITSSGVDVMTSGNHVWDKRAGIPLLDTRKDLLRPANYPQGVPGRGFLIREVSSAKVAIVNLQGRIFMPPIDCPFRCADTILSKVPPDVKVILMDFHAEATSEKLAMGYYMDGRVSAVIGTHTHIQTADERIMPQGTAYITDVGMVGPFDSVIGVKKDQVISRFLYRVPVRFEVASGRPCMGAVLVDIDEVTGKALSIKRVHEEIGEEGN